MPPSHLEVWGLKSRGSLCLNSYLGTNICSFPPTPGECDAKNWQLGQPHRVLHKKECLSVIVRVLLRNRISRPIGRRRVREREVWNYKIWFMWLWRLNFHHLMSVSWETRKSDGVSQFQAKWFRKEATGVSPGIQRPEKGGSWCRGQKTFVSAQEERELALPPSLFYLSPQLEWKRPTHTGEMDESSNSNANPFQKHPHKHTLK